MRLHVALELDDRGAAVLDLRAPLEVEEGLELLQAVAGPRGAEAVAHDLEQVDEDAAAQQVVDLGLAGAVAAHQPPERGDLVGGVVVDVQVRVVAQALVHAGRRTASNAARSLGVVVGPERREVARRRRGCPRGIRGSRPRPRTGCPRSRRRGRRARRRAGARSPCPGCGCRSSKRVMPCLARARAGARPAAELRERLRRRCPAGWLAGGAPEPGERGDPGRRASFVDLRRADAGDAAEVVDLVPPRVADRLEVADAAVVARVGARRAAGRRRTPRAGGARGGSTRRTPAAGSDCRSPEPSSTWICARARAPGAARAARCRSRAGGCRRASRARELRVERLVGTVRAPHRGSRRRPRQRPSVKHALVDDVDARSASPPRSRAAARSQSKSGSSEISVTDLPSARSCARYAASCSRPLRNTSSACSFSAAGLASSPRATWSPSVVRCSHARYPVTSEGERRRRLSLSCIRTSIAPRGDRSYGRSLCYALIANGRGASRRCIHAHIPRESRRPRWRSQVRLANPRPSLCLGGSRGGWRADRRAKGTAPPRLRRQRLLVPGRACGRSAGPRGTHRAHSSPRPGRERGARSGRAVSLRDRGRRSRVESCRGPRRRTHLDPVPSGSGPAKWSAWSSRGRRATPPARRRCQRAGRSSLCDRRAHPKELR